MNRVVCENPDFSSDDNQQLYKHLMNFETSEMSKNNVSVEYKWTNYCKNFTDFDTGEVQKFMFT